MDLSRGEREQTDGRKRERASQRRWAGAVQCLTAACGPIGWLCGSQMALLLYSEFTPESRAGQGRAGNTYGEHVYTGAQRLVTPIKGQGNTVSHPPI